MAMRRIRPFSQALILTVATALAFGSAGCGSDQSGNSDTAKEPAASDSLPAGPRNQPEDKPGGETSGEVRPPDKAPASANDRKDNAPDKVISDRPGGPGQ